MISRSFAIVTACSSFLLIIQTFTPKATALRKLPDVDEFMIENHRTRTRTRQNYIVQREPDDEMSSGVENVGPAFVSEQLEPDSNHEELPALIVDYANMIRNDIILLDNSVETRTRKRGNMESMDQPQCSCESRHQRKEIDLNIKYGEHFVYPSSLMTKVCDSTLCGPEYNCTVHKYNVPILKKLKKKSMEGVDDVPPELKRSRWIAHKEEIVIGCSCTMEGPIKIPTY